MGRAGLWDPPMVATHFAFLRYLHIIAKTLYFVSGKKARKKVIQFCFAALCNDVVLLLVKPDTSVSLPSHFFHHSVLLIISATQCGIHGNVTYQTSCFRKQLPHGSGTLLILQSRICYVDIYYRLLLSV
jgi:hypothetical protein